MEQYYYLRVSGVLLRCALRFPQTAVLLSAIPMPPGKASEPLVQIPPEAWCAELAHGGMDTPAFEASCLSAYVSEALLPHHRAVFHAAALRWRDRAYLICAPSGVGKSTQLKNLMGLCPEAFSVICGDRPILEFVQDAAPAASAERGFAPAALEPVPAGMQPLRLEAEMRPPAPAAPRLKQILVHPSPWNGKENWHDSTAAPLAGLIFLRRGEADQIQRVQPKQIAPAIFAQFFQCGEEAERVRRFASLTTNLLNHVPLWCLTSHRILDSAKLLLDTVFTPEAP